MRPITITNVSDAALSDTPPQIEVQVRTAVGWRAWNNHNQSVAV